MHHLNKIFIGKLNFVNYVSAKIKLAQVKESSLYFACTKINYVMRGRLDETTSSG